MENRQKTLQNEENCLKLSQNGSKIHQIALKHQENAVLSPEIYFEEDLAPKNH